MTVFYILSLVFRLQINWLLNKTAPTIYNILNVNFEETCFFIKFYIHVKKIETTKVSAIFAFYDSCLMNCIIICTECKMPTQNAVTLTLLHRHNLQQNNTQTYVCMYMCSLDACSWKPSSLYALIFI